MTNMRALAIGLLAAALSACASVQRLDAASDVHALLVSIRDDDPATFDAHVDRGALKQELQGKLDERIGKVRKLQPIADQLGVSLAQMAIAWCLLNPNVSTVMLGASRVEQLAHNLDALDALNKLQGDVMQAIEAALA